MRSNYLLLILPFALVSVLFISSQGQDVCPTLSVTGPGGIVAPGDLARYQVSITLLRRDVALKFDWTISTGTIKNGQGTGRIDVLQPAQCITATVEVKGLPADCPFRASENSCGDPMPLSEQLIEIFGTLNKHKLASIDKALEPLRLDKNAKAYVIIYTVRKSEFRKKQRVVQKLFGIESPRVVFVNSRSRQGRIAVWTVPAGAAPPVP